MALAFNGFFSFNLSFQGPRELQSPISHHFSEKPSFAAFLCDNFSQSHVGRGRTSPEPPGCEASAFNLCISSTLTL